MLCSQITHLCRELADARTEADRQLMIMKHKLARMSNNINRLSNRPPVIMMRSTSTQRRQKEPMPTLNIINLSVAVDATMENTTIDSTEGDL